MSEWYETYKESSNRGTINGIFWGGFWLPGRQSLRLGWTSHQCSVSHWGSSSYSHWVVTQTLSLHSPFWIPNRKYKYWIFHQSQIDNNNNNNNKRSLLVEYYRLDEVSTTTQPSATPIPPTLFAIITNPDWIIIVITNTNWIIIVIIISKVLMNYSSRYILVPKCGLWWRGHSFTGVGYLYMWRITRYTLCPMCGLESSEYITEVTRETW